MYIAPRRPQVKILNPKHEILNKPEHSNQKIEIQNDLGKNPKSEYRNPKQFQNLNSQNPKPSNENFSRFFKCFEISILSFSCLFRVSDFVLRILLLFILGVLCVFAARPVEYRLDQDRVVRPKRYSTGRVIFFTIQLSAENKNDFSISSFSSWKPFSPAS